MAGTGVSLSMVSKNMPVEVGRSTATLNSVFLRHETAPSQALALLITAGTGYCEQIVGQKKANVNGYYRNIVIS
jgi:hypothetical protein